MTHFNMRSKLGAVALAVLAAAGSAHAADPKTEGRASAFQGLLDCKAKTDDAARLACYDAAAEGLGAAEQKGDIVVVDRDMAKAVRRQAFGFSLPTLDVFDRSEKSEDAGRLTATATNAYQGGDGKWIFELEGGAVWAQNDNESIFRAPKKGSSVEIRKAAMGGYFLKPDGQRAIRARRVK
jgi:ABC-type amino acid transport substrate-binding protein